ncbi:hypothetical protein BDK51DRAFT_25764 [Blyttiomyces helicus]|uniref:Uncharacterized protein n=1 Tax=Blyttiomyces helicus TaxID=388810 RepID=A0A4P9WK65_9FUNG|nr:hypothetical protein BDK51DRAFT_25764 [Blyttiomyces helicus]|eukprot:RKO92373.1 hypothetical protein BDK51DRAFT_25764 [Blyttiomyces helicus]
MEKVEDDALAAAAEAAESPSCCFYMESEEVAKNSLETAGPNHLPAGGGKARNIKGERNDILPKGYFVRKTNKSSGKMLAIDSQDADDEDHDQENLTSPRARSRRRETGVMQVATWESGKRFCWSRFDNQHSGKHQSSLAAVTQRGEPALQSGVACRKADPAVMAFDRIVLRPVAQELDTAVIASNQIILGTVIETGTTTAANQWHLDSVSLTGAPPSMGPLSFAFYPSVPELALSPVIAIAPNLESQLPSLASLQLQAAWWPSLQTVARLVPVLLIGACIERRKWSVASEV